MPLKEWRLLARDIAFYVNGESDVAPAAWGADPWLYPADWSYQLDREADHFEPKDPDGIPVRVYPPPIGVRYLPSRIATYGLAHWNRWSERHDQLNQGEFIRVANWLRSTHDDGRYMHDIKVAGLDKPWISCIAQGEAASVLTRAFRLTSDRAYLVAAERAAHWLTVPEEQGGLLSRLPDGSPFLEEYPGTSYRHVLNGCLYAMVGISDFARVEGNAGASALLRELTDSVAVNLPHWDVDGWSTYDYPLVRGRRRNLNTMTYQVLCVVLLEYLAHVTGDARLALVAQKWKRSAERFPARMRALAGKLTYRVAAGW